MPVGARGNTFDPRSPCVACEVLRNESPVETQCGPPPAIPHASYLLEKSAKTTAEGYIVGVTGGECDNKNPSGLDIDIITCKLRHVDKPITNTEMQWPNASIDI